MEFLLFFLLPSTLIIYGVGMFAWAGIYLVKYIDGSNRAEREMAAKRLLQSPIWPITVLGILHEFIKELKMVAKEGEK